MRPGPLNNHQPYRSSDRCEHPNQEHGLLDKSARLILTLSKRGHTTKSHSQALSPEGRLRYFPEPVKHVRRILYVYGPGKPLKLDPCILHLKFTHAKLTILKENKQCTSLIPGLLRVRVVRGGKEDPSIETLLQSPRTKVNQVRRKQRSVRRVARGPNRKLPYFRSIGRRPTPRNSHPVDDMDTCTCKIHQKKRKET